MGRKSLCRNNGMLRPVKKHLDFFSEGRVLPRFLVLHFVLWFLVAMIISSLLLDTAEAIVWGGEWTFTTNKHPFLSGWVAQIAVIVFGNVRVAAAFLAAACSTAAIWLTYRFARSFMERPKAVVAAMLQEACVYYSVYSLKYNCNLLSAVLAPLFFWMVWRALTTDALRHWIATGLVAGLLAMTKYSNGALMAGVAIYLLIWRRDVFRRPGVYLAGLVCLGICMPHLVALYREGFACFDYVEESARVSVGPWAHVKYPVAFLVSQAFNVWGAVLLIVVAAVKKKFRFGAVHPYLLCVGVVPLMTFPCFSVVTGSPLRDMWGFAFASVWPLVVMAGLDVQTKFMRLSVRLLILVLVVQAVVMTFVAVFHTSRSWLDVDDLVAQLPVKNPAYIGGSTWLCSEVAITMERRPHVAYQMDFRRCPWISREEMERAGFVVLEDNPIFFDIVRQRYPDMQQIRTLSLNVKAPFGRKKQWTALVGYVPPRSSQRR